MNTLFSPQIKILDNFLSEEEVSKYRKMIDSYEQPLLSVIFCNKADIVDNFWKDHGERLTVECGISELKPLLTVSRSTRNLDWHYDRGLDGDTHRVLVYLDNVAGTLFRLEDGSVHRVAPLAGRAVIFDYRIEHAGEKVPEGYGDKYTLGFRAVISQVPTEKDRNLMSDLKSLDPVDSHQNQSFQHDKLVPISVPPPTSWWTHLLCRVVA